MTFQPAGLQVAALAGTTVLEVAERNELPIEAGCRMGMCGSDPITVLDGMENLSPVGHAERATMQRLALPEGARLACCAQVYGHVAVTLAVDRTAASASPTLVFGAYDPSVQHVVIIGNGIAGITAADHTRRRHPTCSIDVIGRERHHLYNRMAISRLIYGRSAMDGLYLLPEAWYAEHAVTPWLNTQAAAVDPVAHTVTLATGETLPYDRLVLAVGSRSSPPPIDAFGLAGSFVLRAADDAMQIRAFVQEYRCRSAVVGGGPLGLEAGYALLKVGLDVTVMERSSRLLSRQLDGRGVARLQSYLEGLGLRFMLGAQVSAARGSERLEWLDLTGGDRLKTDLLLASVGITPNVDLAREAGLAVHRGVLVDDALRTSDPDIFAAGDVAEYKEQIYGLWPAAVEQGEIAAANATGGDRRYRGSIPTTILKISGVDLTSIGQIDAESAGDVAITSEDDSHVYRKVVLRDGRAIGAILLGDPVEARAIVAAVEEQRDLTPYLAALQAGDWTALTQPPAVAPPR